MSTAPVIETSIKEWGTSRGVRIPKSMCEYCFMDIGTDITMTAGTDEVGPYVMIRPVPTGGSKYADVPGIAMDAVFSDWNGNYQPTEADWGTDIGDEVVA